MLNYWRVICIRQFVQQHSWQDLELPVLSIAWKETHAYSLINGVYLIGRFLRDLSDHQIKALMIHD